MTQWGTTKASDKPSGDMIYAPWTPEEVQNLNRWQVAGGMHPFTCGGQKHDGEIKPSLIAEHDGWVCPVVDCNYRQNWAHAFMADSKSMEWWEDQLSGFRTFLAEHSEQQHRRLLLTMHHGDSGEINALVDAACEVMHDAYEQAALGAGWETNPESRKPWSDVPEANKQTMRAAVRALLNWLGGE